MPVTVNTFFDKKRRGEKVAVVTAYDALVAAMVHAAGADAILVGDSAAMVFSGHDTTLPITMDEMLYHTRAVTRGAKGAFIIADMPFLSFQCGHDDAVLNAGRFLKEGAAHAVKIEGGHDPALVERLVSSGIPVMGHLGLTPQSVHAIGGYRAQGKTAESADTMMAHAQALDRAGCFSIVLECVPSDLAARVSAAVHCPTIGIGAGPGCDGQVSVINDLLGLSTGYLPRHAKRYARLYDEGLAAVRAYVADVRSVKFPEREHEVAAPPDLRHAAPPESAQNPALP
ncbi:MAG TPA: 3-methyl-2-oxobutanoate hydroxymethyltransferase [Candidatus Eremiobacteraceae bacterium]|nr:3-methyl-2-oxobutanoate hydroxymethyltransferase [Candidatus Eremiobacteraceae bacterium]